MCAIPSAMPYKVMVRGELGPRDPSGADNFATAASRAASPVTVMPQRHNINEWSAPNRSPAASANAPASPMPEQSLAIRRVNVTDAEMHNARERRLGLTSVIRRKRSGPGPGLHALWLALRPALRPALGAALLGVRWAAAPRRRATAARPPSPPRALAWPGARRQLP